MDKGFFRSREFTIAIALALLVLAGGAFAIQNAYFGHSREGSIGCAAPGEAEGVPLATLARTQGDSPRHRILSHAFDASAFAQGRLALCGDYGDVAVTVSPNATAEVRFHVFAARDGDQAPLDRTDVRVALDARDGRVVLSAWTAAQPVYALDFGSSTLVNVKIEVLLPAHLAWDLDVEAGSGDVVLTGIRVRDARVDSDFGHVEARALDLSGNLTVETGSGGIDLVLASVQTGRILLDSSFGDIVARLPERADVGYDVRVEASFGDADVRIGPAEAYETTDDGTHVRSAGYDAKPTKVVIDVETGSGDVEVALAQP